MDSSFDQHGINHATVAVRLEMNPQAHRRNGDVDTLFFGGGRPTDAGQAELADFGLRKNYKLIFASFDPADPSAGPTAFTAVVTDGDRETIVLTGGRLWKQDRRSPALLLFSAFGAVVKVSSKGCMVVRGMKDRYHDQGFDFAREAVVDRAARKPGRVPVVSQLGSVVTVLDARMLAATLEPS